MFLRSLPRPVRLTPSLRIPCFALPKSAHFLVGALPMSVGLNIARSRYQKHRVHKGSWRDCNGTCEALRLQTVCRPESLFILTCQRFQDLQPDKFSAVFPPRAVAAGRSRAAPIGTN